MNDIEDVKLNEHEKTLLLVFVMLYIGVFWVIPWAMAGTIKGVAVVHLAIPITAVIFGVPSLIARWAKRNTEKAVK